MHDLTAWRLTYLHLWRLWASITNGIHYVSDRDDHKRGFHRLRFSPSPFSIARSRRLVVQRGIPGGLPWVLLPTPSVGFHHVFDKMNWFTSMTLRWWTAVRKKWLSTGGWMNHDSLVFLGGNEGSYACGAIVVKRRKWWKLCLRDRKSFFSKVKIDLFTAADR